MKALDYIRVVLVEPTHPGNIGATARAMANMGVSNLALVNPREFPSPVATARAAGADTILDNAVVASTVMEAISDCTLVMGTTARIRSIEWPSLQPWEAMELAGNHGENSPVAVLFGRESSGLTNEELDFCHHLVRIPVNEDFYSLNLGSAVTVILYELRKNLLQRDLVDQPVPDEPLATAEQMNHFFAHLESVITRLRFTDGRSSTLMRKIIRMFNRIQPYEQEVNILRGILTSVDRQIHESNSS